MRIVLCRTGGRYNRKLLQSPPPCPTDLSPSPAIDGSNFGSENGAAQRLIAAAKACESSLVPEHHTEAMFAPLAAEGMDAPLRSCFLSAAASHLDESSAAIFLLNNIACLEAALRTYQPASLASLASLAGWRFVDCSFAWFSVRAAGYRPSRMRKTSSEVALC